MHFTPSSAREHFSALHQSYNGQSVVFLDGPGGSQVPGSVLKAMTDYLGQYNSNLGGHYFSSKETVELVTKARHHGKALLNAEEVDNIVFGANMTSLTFQLSRAIARNWQPNDEVIVTALDHYSNVSSWQQAAEDKGAVVKQVKVDESDCSLDFEHLESLISEKTRLIAVTYASNTTGSITDIKRIVELAKRVGALVYVDAVHFAPHALVDVQDLECDFLVCSAYKFFGPHLGLAYISPTWLQSLKPYKVEPATDIGPGRFETGTQNFEAMAGFIEAVRYLASWGKGQSLRQQLVSAFKDIGYHEEQISRYFLERLSRCDSLSLYGIADSAHSRRTPTFALRSSKHSPELMAKSLGEQNICVWNGHFYALGLVKQLGLEDKGGVLRVGFMHYNTLEEVDRFFDAIENI
ncbi:MULTISPECIES: cysteine desulfurase-like protein [unclassified Vibrio]|uniref:cysteine desulfurase-like protein n=1 Tax=unclassified Vibrio TaxID=2614977 RepID=UPI001F058530|nr:MULTISPECIES: cysteine desulfurase-like protein [unclassified Vibrio]MDA0109997.1 cysteine desulfurase-like protein [Vibrio sp. La 4.2.2]